MGLTKKMGKSPANSQVRVRFLKGRRNKDQSFGGACKGAPFFLARLLRGAGVSWELGD